MSPDHAFEARSERFFNRLGNFEGRASGLRRRNDSRGDDMLRSLFKGRRQGQDLFCTFARSRINGYKPRAADG